MIRFGIYCKPTTTNNIIHNNSCHPHEHKKSVINYLINRKNTYQLTHESRVQEKAIINEILISNGYQQEITCQKHKPPLTPHIQHKRQNGPLSHIMAQTPESLLFCNINLKQLTNPQIQINTT
jgi:hypothetical protein